MSEVIETPVVTPAEPVAAPVELPEQTYIYQPTDESNRPLGGKQVIKYRTPDELTQKLVEQNTLLIRKLREEKRKNVGIFDASEIPAEAPRVEESVQFEPRILTPDERVKLSRDLLDPEKFEEASNTLFEATVGASPEKLRKTLKGLQDGNQTLQSRAEADQFMAANSDYYPCRANGEVIVHWITGRGLQLVRENYQRAYDALKAQGNVLIERPTVEPPLTPVPDPIPAPVVPVVEPVAPAAPPAQPAPAAPAPIPTGLTRNQATDTGGTPRNAADEIVYEVAVKDRKNVVIGKKVYKGLQAIDAMPADEYRRRVMTDPDFRKKAEALEAEAQRKRQATAAQQ